MAFFQRIAGQAGSGCHVPGCVLVMMMAMLAAGCQVGQSTRPVSTMSPKLAEEQQTATMGYATPELAARAAISARLEMPVSLKIEVSSRHPGWAFLAGQPLTTRGLPIDYSHTRYAKDLAEGFFDDNFAALLQQSDTVGTWSTAELSLGATDAPFVAWPARYGLPMSLVSPGSF